VQVPVETRIVVPAATVLPAAGDWRLTLTPGTGGHVVPSAKGRRRYEQIRNARTDAVSLAIAGLTDAERRRLAAALPVLESLAATLRDGRA